MVYLAIYFVQKKGPDVRMYLYFQAVTNDLTNLLGTWKEKEWKIQDIEACG